MAAQSAPSPGGGADKKPTGEGPELSESTGQVAQNEDAHESQTKLPFIPSEPMREDQVQNAVKFLSHPKVRGSPVIYRRSFLERKGLSKEEIDEAFRLVPDPPPNSAAADTVATSQATQPRTSTNLQPQAPLQPLQPASSQLGAVSLAPVSQRSRLNWFNALVAIGLLSASGAGTAVLFKKVVLSRLKAWIRKVAGESDGPVKEDTKKSLAEETAEAAKAAASAAAIVATASQELLNSKNQERKYFEAFMGMIDVQVKEMKSMTDAIHRLEKSREQDTVNGTTNNSWRPSQQVSQTDTLLNKVNVNGLTNAEYVAAKQSVPSAPVEPETAPHSKSYMEIMAMVHRGEKPPNIREINDMPPNPNQQPSMPLVAPRAKPWEFAQQTSLPISIENGRSKDVSPEPWWRKKSVQITELESEGEDSSKQFPYGNVSERPSGQKAWVPPQPPSVVMPEAAAAIRHLKPSPPLQKQHLDDEKVTTISGDADGVGASASDSVVDNEYSGGASIVPNHSEIEEEVADGIQVM